MMKLSTPSRFIVAIVFAVVAWSSSSHVLATAVVVVVDDAHQHQQRRQHDDDAARSLRGSTPDTHDHNLFDRRGHRDDAALSAPAAAHHHHHHHDRNGPFDVAAEIEDAAARAGVESIPAVPPRKSAGSSSAVPPVGTLHITKTTAVSSPAAPTAAPMEAGTGRACRSIIAIGNTRLPPSKRVLNAENEEDDVVATAATTVEGAVAVQMSPVEDQREETTITMTTMREDEDDGESFVCELMNGETVPILSTPGQLSELRIALNSGNLISSVSTVDVIVGDDDEKEEDGEEEENGEENGEEKDDGIAGISPPKGAMASLPDFVFANTEGTTTSTNPPDAVTLPSGSIVIHTDPTRRLQHGHRSLASYSGKKHILIVRVIDALGSSVPDDAMYVSDKFFGTDGDGETFMSQFDSCSYGDFDVTYHCVASPDDAGTCRDDDGVVGEYDERISPFLSAPGVLEIELDVTLDVPQHRLRSEMNRRVSETLGGSENFPLPGPFSHVLYVIAECKQGCGWAAYAYVNSWLSVYQRVFYRYPAVAMHEVGHNLNLAHSGGTDGKAYTDHSCLMGNPLFDDDVADMCFNPAKNYQIVTSGDNDTPSSRGNWYSRDRIRTYDSTDGTGGWTGKLVGIAELGTIGLNDTDNFQQHGDSKIVLKLETGTESDLYVGFNRATGFNADNVAHDDVVTIVEAGGEGRTYSQSYLRAALAEGESISATTDGDAWRGNDGEALVVTVDRIRTDVEPGYAQVTVRLGNREVVVAGTEDSTDPPTATPQPTRQPTNLVRYDVYLLILFLNEEKCVWRIKCHRIRSLSC